MNRRADIPAAASFFTPTLPLLNDEQYVSLASGYLPARPARLPGENAADEAHLYFVLERARHVGAKRRLIIWMNGGPGCSSFDGLMMEVGAFRPDMRGGLEWTKAGGAWNEYADVLYLDQPVGTGFSYVNTNGYANSLEQAADEVVYFLDRFIEVYPEYAKGNGVDIYIAGESFAGQYIPFTAAALLKKGRAMPVDLRGLAIGNGFIDPKAQGGTELDMMVESKLWDTNSQDYREVKAMVDECRKAVDRDTSNERKIRECDGILSAIIRRTTGPSDGKEMCVNIYDVRLKDLSPACGMNWPLTLKSTYAYLSRPDVRKALHVDQKHKPEAWVECNHRVGGGIESDLHGKASVVHLPYILEHNVPVLLFAGDQDLICNHIGVERVAEQLQWGGKGWGAPEKKDWFVNNKNAGYWRTNRNLTYVSVADASHMVGVDKPVEAHDMMLRFMGVDLMNAAGPSAQIPSRLQGEPDRILVVAGGGTAGQDGHDNRPMIPGVSGKTEEQVAEEAKWAAYYNAGSAALIVLLLLFGTGTCILLRLRRKSRLQGGSSAPFLPVSTEDRADSDAHEMDRFIGEDGRARSRSREDFEGEDGDTTYSEETYRMDAATASNTLANGRRASPAMAEYRDDDDDDGDKKARAQSRGGGGNGNGDGIAQRDHEQIFDVGDESDEDVTIAGRDRTGGHDAVRFA